jgi:eukaryotic-like serine/threonine-protein kinase
MRSIREFLVELKKRHVYRVAVAYAIVAWAIVEVASTVVPELGLPGWITPTLILVALLGFPLALVLAWAYDLGPDGVQRTAPTDAALADRPRAASPRRRVRPGLAVVLGIALVVAGGLGVYAYNRAAADVPRGAALHSALAELADSARYAEAFALAARADEAGEDLPDSVRARFTDRISILSDPAGAAVRARRFVADGEAGTGAAWQELGRTPLRGLPIARGDYHIVVEADAHAPVERIGSSAGLRALFGDRSIPEVQLDVRLLPADRALAGTVFVPGGLYRVASHDLQSLSATLDDFHIDRYEVTNAAFAEFVDAGGYGRREFWSDLVDAERAATDDVLRRLVDRTGMPAPREWSGQRPPGGSDDHPVTGVSWYEAAAYCRFRRMALPTLFEWEKAARDGATSRRSVELPWGYVGPGEPAHGRANFDGRGTTPVGSFPFGVSPYGAYDMAGNVKEWLRNRTEAGHAVTGGSWADPLYVFSRVGSIAPEAASSSVGFRCARVAQSERGNARAQGGDPLRLAVQAPVYEPVDDATFRALLTHYHYDAQPLDAEIEERVEAPGWTRERIRYDGPAGQRVIAYLFLPRTGSAPHQTLVYVPSSLAFLGVSLATIVENELGPLIRGGRAVFAVVMEGMTEREYPQSFEQPATSSVAFRDQMVRRATELRLGLDYLETRDDIDASRIAYIGKSWGAGSRVLFAAVDDRFRATVLIGAGIDERVHPTLPEASNINFASRIRGPKLVLNGRQDEEHPWLTRGLPLWNLLSEPKELALFDGAGHSPPDELTIPAIHEFLDRHLR